METLNFVKNASGVTTGIFIHLEDRKKLSEEMIEDIEDLISYELRKEDEKITLEQLKAELKK